METQFQTIELSSQVEIAKCYQKEQTRSSIVSFSNMFLWAPYNGVTYATVEKMTLFRFDGNPIFCTFPMGREYLKEAMESLFQYFDSNQIEFCMKHVTEEQFSRLEELYPNQFQIEYDRDRAEYIYEVERLSTLAGKKLHGKRNHINKFKGEYPNWLYETITEENKEDCYTMLKQWGIDNQCEEDSEKIKEQRVSENALKYREELGLVGGLIRLQPDGEVVAFSIGEVCNEDMFIVHIEKAFSNVQGAYPMINQQVLIHEASECKYVNREEDLGIEGLRKAKLSYKPSFLLEKGVVTKIGKR